MARTNSRSVRSNCAAPRLAADQNECRRCVPTGRSASKRPTGVPGRTGQGHELFDVARPNTAGGKNLNATGGFRNQLAQQRGSFECGASLAAGKDARKAEIDQFVERDHRIRRGVESAMKHHCLRPHHGGDHPAAFGISAPSSRRMPKEMPSTSCASNCSVSRSMARNSSFE